jgi:uncharacterized cupredoxin-like copper-binding protein
VTGSRRVIIAILTVSALGMGACGGDDGTTAPQAAGTTSVAVTLQEWAVLPAQASAPAGSVTFQAENKGPKHEHEFVVFKTDLAANALPTKADGSVDEAGAGVQALGEIEEFDVGATQSKTFTLTAGKYVLFCNVVEDEAMAETGGIKAHYKLGMFTAFTVN